MIRSNRSGPIHNYINSSMGPLFWSSSFASNLKALFHCTFKLPFSSSTKFVPWFETIFSRMVLYNGSYTNSVVFTALRIRPNDAVKTYQAHSFEFLWSQTKHKDFVERTKRSKENRKMCKYQIRWIQGSEKFYWKHFEYLQRISNNI